MTRAQLTVVYTTVVSATSVDVVLDSGTVNKDKTDVSDRGSLDSIRCDMRGRRRKMYGLESCQGDTEQE